MARRLTVKGRMERAPSNAEIYRGIKQERRAAARLREHDAKVEWFVRERLNDVNVTVRQRTNVAAQLVKDKVKINLAKPVRKVRFRGKTRVDPKSRSKPGEFPRADTTALMKSIFHKTTSQGAVAEAIVGTPLDYGLILETRMKRSFLVRTLREMQAQIIRIMTTPPGGGSIFAE